MTFAEQIKVCSRLLGHSGGKKTGGKARHVYDKAYLGSMQTRTQTYTRSYKECVETAHPGALELTVDIGKGICTAGAVQVSAT